MMEKWDRRFLELAAFIARWSKDPSTKVGGVVVSPDRSEVYHGYNGLPRRIHDYPDRYDDRNTKYNMIVHGEINAILCAHHRLDGHTLYTYPFGPCSVCASIIVQAGITRVVAPVCIKEEGHWMHESLRLSGVTFLEAGIKFEQYPFELTMMVNSK